MARSTRSSSWTISLNRRIATVSGSSEPTSRTVPPVVRHYLDPAFHKSVELVEMAGIGHHRELEQLSMDPRSSPTVLTDHAADQLADFSSGSGTPWASPPRFPSPIRPETSAVSPDNGFRSNDDQRLTPSGPGSLEKDPEGPIGIRQPRTRLVRLWHSKLLA